MGSPLDGVRVLELSGYVSGPYAGMLLGDLGAEVIKVEHPDGGDPFRAWGTGSYSPAFGSVNRNKKSITLDFKSPEGLREAISLARSADVLIENFRVGVLDRLGLGYEALSRENSRLIYCSITGFGQDGPYSSRPGYDTVGQAMGGLLSLLTDLDAPRGMGISLSDHLAGLFAAYGVLGALHARERTGTGQRVCTSLLESTVSFLGENAAGYFETGRNPDRNTRVCAAQVYAFVAEDGLPFVIHLSSPQKFWQGLVRATGDTALLQDPRYADVADRRANFDALHGALAAIFRTRPRREWLARLEANDVPCAPINTLAEVFEDEQVQHLGLVQEALGAESSRPRLVRGPVTFSATPAPRCTAAPALGAHNAELTADGQKFSDDNDR